LGGGGGGGWGVVWGRSVDFREGAELSKGKQGRAGNSVPSSDGRIRLKNWGDQAKIKGQGRARDEEKKLICGN